MESIPRSEHPDPQLRRNEWTNLNGQWSFRFDFGASGIDRKFYSSGAWDRTITVPFCPESILSGIHHTDFVPMVWYRRTVTLEPEQLTGRTLLHFGAVDYEATVWVNGQQAGTHRGGYTSFTLDITRLVIAGENEIVVCAKDDNRSGRQPRGKQSEHFQSQGCDYTRTTGIWQTVWLEFVPDAYLRRVEYYPNLASKTLTIRAFTEGSGVLLAEAFYEGRSCGRAETAANGLAILTLPLSELHLWEAGAGRLYDL